MGGGWWHPASATACVRGHHVPLDGSQLCMHYFDSRGVFRVYDVAVDDEGWRLWRDSPGFSRSVPSASR